MDVDCDERYEDGFNILFSMLENKSDASLFILNVLDWTGQDLKLISEKLIKLN